MSCRLCLDVGRGDLCELCLDCDFHHKPESACVIREPIPAKYRCCACKHTWTGVVEMTRCPHCKHLYVKWLR